MAGTIKGTVGIGLPTASLGILTLVLDPRTAIAFVLIPMTVSNAWQIYRAGDLAGAVLRYWRLAALLMLFIGITLALTANAPDRLLTGTLGGVIVAYVLAALTGWSPTIPDRLDRPAQVFVGVTAGILGGLTSVWGPPMLIYLAARQVRKAEFVRATGFLIFLGSMPLLTGYIIQGFLTRETGLLSVALLLPTFAGFWLGERLRGRMSEDRFRLIVLLIFLAMGLNLLRRALI